MAIDLETSAFFAEGFQEDPSPHQRPLDLAEWTGMYTVLLRCTCALHEDSVQEAHDFLSTELDDHACDDIVAPLVFDSVTSTELRPDCVIDEPYSGHPRSTGQPPSHLYFVKGWGDQVPGEKPAPRIVLTEVPAERAAEILARQPEPTLVEAASEGPHDYTATFEVELSCARPVWALKDDEPDADRVLAEDVAALDTPASLDDWRDEVTMVTWTILDIRPVDTADEAT